jgi:hypothetical protein
MLALASLHGATVLKARSIAFLKKNAGEVVQSESWRELRQNHPDVVDAVVTGIASL